MLSGRHDGHVKPLPTPRCTRDSYAHGRTGVQGILFETLPSQMHNPSISGIYLGRDMLCLPVP